MEFECLSHVQFWEEVRMNIIFLDDVFKMMVMKSVSCTVTYPQEAAGHRDDSLSRG